MTALYPWLMPIYHQIAQTFDEGLGHHAVLIKADAGLSVERLRIRRQPCPYRLKHCFHNQRVCLINRCFSHFQSASFILCRLSCCFLPFAKPISILIFPREKCKSSGTMV